MLFIHSSCVAYRNKFKQKATNNSKIKQVFICRKEAHLYGNWAGSSAAQDWTDCPDIGKIEDLQPCAGMSLGKEQGKLDEYEMPYLFSVDFIDGAVFKGVFPTD